MRGIRQLILAALLSAGTPLMGQTNVVPISTDTTRDGRIVSPDQVKVETDEEPTTSDSINHSELIDKLRATRPEYPRLSPEMVRKLREFKRQRERYLQMQQQLIKRYKGANDLERRRIREQLQDRRRDWLEQSRSFRQNARERLRDILRELPKHREALEAAREAVDGTSDLIRKRPRTD